MTARTEHPGRPTARALRRALRREVPTTVGLLADEEDFTTMRAYRTFPFDDHTAYLRHTEALIRRLAAQGLHTDIALFDPVDYAWHCADTGRAPDSPAHRARYTAGISAAGGAVLTYTGQPLDLLLPALADTAVRRATHAYATAVLADLGTCAECHQDIGRAALDHATALLHRLLERAGPGTHHLVCSTPAGEDPLTAALTVDRTIAGTPETGSPTTEFSTVLAVSVALDTPAGLVMRTSAEGVPDSLRGWRLARGRLVPLSAAEVFNAYCTDAETGEPIGPEPGVDYRAGFDLGPGVREFGH
ncbi:hypothetical protein [Streptomyces tremellae]|uniref:Uncharacterized protein n=1 Tax=Streptomyces tremellae TaxID=1124239 RepID=A0ABP7GFC7_9ACTN